MNMRINVGWVGASALALVLGLQGCGGGGEDTTSTASQIVVNTPAMLTQVSADDYEQNVNGLITAATLKRWKDHWATERAKLGLTGKLVILQVSAGPVEGMDPSKPVNTTVPTTDPKYNPPNPDADISPTHAPYIKPLGGSVFVYLSPSSEWTQVRTNGVIETVQVVPDGAQMDGILKKYNIDPRNDMIVAAMGTGGNNQAMAQGRIWYALRYWGVDKKNLALLNGGNQWIVANGMTDADFEYAPAAAPNTGTISVKSLLVDNTQLQATLDDMLKILPSSNTNVLNDGVFIWDARGISEYNGSQFTGNRGSRQGHPNGALELDYTNMLDSAKGHSYKPKSVLENYLNGGDGGVVGGASFIAGDGAGGYPAVGIDKAYQPGDTVYTYCETTFRAMITGVASAVILGLPTRFYDGAMVEWNSLSYIADKNGDYILPFDSPWRTEAVSFSLPQTNPALINPRVITDAYAANANAVVNADKAYKTGESTVGAGGSSGGAPANPCGG